MAQVIKFTSMTEAPVLLTDAQIHELETSPAVAGLRHFSLMALTYTPAELLQRVRGSEEAREGLAEGLQIVEQYIDCVAANLELAKLAKARLLVVAGAYNEEVLRGCDD